MRYPQVSPLWVVLYDDGPNPVNRALMGETWMDPMAYVSLDAIERETGIALRIVIGWKEQNDEVIPVYEGEQIIRKNRRYFHDQGLAHRFIRSKTYDYPEEIRERMRMRTEYERF